MAVLNLNNAVRPNKQGKGGQGQYTLTNAMSVGDAVYEFQKKIRQAGLGEQDILADGQIHRFQTPEDRQGQKSGWYVFYADHIPAGQFGNWKTDYTETFFALQDAKGQKGESCIVSEAEREAFETAMEKAKKAREAERQKIADETARTAVKLWNKASESRDVSCGSGSYLEKKGLEPWPGARFIQEDLLIPLYNVYGEIRNLQFIKPNGEKRFLSGGEKRGNFCVIGGDDTTCYICEGWATGASLHRATGNTVIVAFDAGNLLPVCENVKKIMPQSVLVIAADNDRFTKKNGMPCNVGLEKAYQAASAVGASVVYPEFKDSSSFDSSLKPTDFNDLMQLEGLEAVRIQSLVAGDGPKILEWGVEHFEGKAPAVQWLVKDILPMSCPCLLAAAGGTGKGMMSLDLALSVAQKNTGLFDLNKKEWLGREVAASGSCVILSAEDSKDSIHQRLEALDPTGERRKAARGNLFIVPLPNSGGPVQLVTAENYGKRFAATPAYENLKRQLRRIPNLKLINIDPLASFVGCDVNADPQAGAFVQGLLASLAEETGACVLVAHHMSKPKGGINGAGDARNAVRGTTALVDGVRLAMAVWQASKETCDKVNKGILPKSRRDIFEFAVVKANAPCDMETHVLVRGKDGLLRCVDEDMQKKSLDRTELETLLIESIRDNAEAGRPFSKRGQNGVYARREDLHKKLRSVGRNKIEEIVQELLEEEKIVAATYKSSIAKFLDVPDGPFADGTATIDPGWIGGRPKENEGKNWE